MFSNTHTVITKTPFRVSILGGGLDLPPHCINTPGEVVGFTINYFSYFMCKKLLPIFNYKSRLTYSEIEEVKSNADIQHRYFRAAMDYFRINEGVEINYMADCPAKTGLGTSSSFITGLIKAVSSLRGRELAGEELFKLCVYIEQEVLRERVGYQDAFWAAFPGVRYAKFEALGNPFAEPSRDFTNNPYVNLTHRPLYIPDPTEYLRLYYTGLQRISESVSKTYKVTPDHLGVLRDTVRKGIPALDRADFKAIGRLLKESWEVKKGLSPMVSTEWLDDVEQKSLDAGSYGGKLLGAGGGGCFLMAADPDNYMLDVKMRDLGLKKIPISVFYGDG